MERKESKSRQSGVPLVHALTSDLKTTDLVRKELVDIRSDLLSFRASATDAVKWYYGQDPLREFEAMRQVAAEAIGPAAALLTMQGGRFDRKVHEAAAAVLVANVYIPEIMQGAVSSRFDELRRLGNTYLPEKSQITGQLFENHSDITSLVMYIGMHTERKRASYSISDLENLRMAADLLSSSASTQIPELSNVIIRTGGKSYEMTAEAIRRLLALDLYLTVAKEGLQSNSETAKFIGLEAAMGFSAQHLSQFSRQEVRTGIGMEPVKKIMTDLVDNFDTIFVQNPEMNAHAKKGKYQGKLHEYMWYLDTLFYLEATRRHHIKLFPAQRAEDQPRIGYPTANRGFDFYLLDARNNSFLLVQLKTNKNGNYHPLITLVHEPEVKNYTEADLQQKLAFYRQTLENGFVNPSIDQAVLPSVVSTIAELDSKGKNLLNFVNETYGIADRPEQRKLTRQQRRAIERKHIKRQRNNMRSRYTLDL